MDSSRFFWLIALVGLPALGWLGLLDQFSAEQLDGSITAAGLIYATARGINAVVSLLQGTELNLPFLTFTVGELLDPLNDLIERFSSVVLIALGSLALQKILLALVSETLFNVLLTLLALVAGVALFTAKAAIASLLLRSFVVLAFFRFALGLVVLANGWVDAAFLNQADEQRHAAMEKFQGELRELDSLSRAQDEAAKKLEALLRDASVLQEQRSDLQARRLESELHIAAAETELARLREAAGGVCRTIILACPDEVKEAKEKLDKLQRDKATLIALIAEKDKSLEENAEQESCLKRQLRGEACTLWDKLPDAPSAGELRQKLNEINAGLSNFADNCVSLLMSLLLKTVVIPLAFLYLLLKVARASVARAPRG